MGKGRLLNLLCRCGSGKKYKKCCLKKDEKSKKLEQLVKNITRSDFISGPYKNCPNTECLASSTFGVFMPISDSDTYSRECTRCGYQESFDLPQIQKKVIYLDQFVISNLVKLLDKSHSSHLTIKSDPFWESLFKRLEKASKFQAIVCPDSFYHQNESLIGKINFKLMKRLYEHFSNGKTLYPDDIIQKNQIVRHFESWLDHKKVLYQFKPEDIAFERDLHRWSVGMRISAGGGPYVGQIESLQKNSAITREQLKSIWARWQNEKDVKFVDRVKEETLGLGKGVLESTRQFMQRREITISKMAAGVTGEMDLDGLLPPTSKDMLQELMNIAVAKGLKGEQVAEAIMKYFSDVDSLLEIPQIKISSVMFAGWAHRAASGKKNPPKSSVDVQFISSYLPYCDAMFVDKESALLLKEFPKGTPENLRLKEFSARVYSLDNRDDFLDYLDQLVADIPANQTEILKDMEGENYGEPYWNIIEREKQEIKDMEN